jgi:hypothetical protein
MQRIWKRRLGPLSVPELFSFSLRYSLADPPVGDAELV